MFEFFKKKESKELILCAPLEGNCVDLKEVPDQMFASGIMGNGMAFIPSGNVLYAPCKAKVSMIAATKHAIGLVTPEGMEILLHIGLDTVNFNGKGFKVKVSVNDTVKQGQPLIEFDRTFFEGQHVNMITPLVITNSSDFELVSMKTNQEVSTKTAVANYQKKS